MQYRTLILVLTTLAFTSTLAGAEVPVNVRCAISAQEKARNRGPEYQNVYRRTFELCMLNAMPTVEQTEYLIEKQQPYVAVSPGRKIESVQPVQEARAQEPKSSGTWVRRSPHVWVLEKD